MEIDLTELGIRYPAPDSVWRDFISAVLTRNCEAVNIVHALAGRGAAKTFVMMICFFILMTDRRYGYVGEEFTWYGPTTNTEDYDDTFLGTLRKIIPENLYSLNYSKRRVTLVNGSVIKYRGRLATNANREPGRGPGCRVMGLDETCKDPTDKAWKTIFGTLRGYVDTSRPYVIMTTSTPVLGSWYQRVVERGSGVCFHASSYDNPVANPDAIQAFKDELTDEEIAQEIYGKWVALSGLAWNNVNLGDTWPNGNMHHHVFDPSMPWDVWCDIGVQSAWIIVQHPRTPSGHYLDVAVAQLTPNDGDTDKVGTLINETYGHDSVYRYPSKVIVGRDVSTRSSVDGSTSEKKMLKNLGWPNIRVVKDRHKSKQLQYAVAKRCLKTSTGHRQFCISTGLETHYDNDRGLVQMFKRDQWPERIVMGEFLPKDKKTKGGMAIEDIRDAFTYGCIEEHPPRNYGADLAGR